MPIRTVSQANKREHWSQTYKRAKSQKKTAFLIAHREFHVHSLEFGERIEIKIVRLYGRRGKLLDADNLANSNKAVIDGLCKALGRDDGDQRIKFVFEQSAATNGEYSVLVTISDRPS